MKEFLFVGLGGAVGAMLRYGMSMVPVKSEFPYMTLLINFLGAVAIGILAAPEHEAGIVNGAQSFVIENRCVRGIHHLLHLFPGGGFPAGAA